ncbi:CTP synthase [Candidatus Saccharibacteria bacterium CPR2]|nr:CTP synthase [Candidatus Saccharibacteria bacterium CPR2]
MARKETRFIFVTGGVLSGLGKGITAASIGTILKSRGLSVNIQKLDPYLNVDAGTLNPTEHGECFVTKDGAETDLDLGHYERFLDIELTQKSSVMSGRILRDLIQDEREGKYLGKTVQLVPHFTNAIQERIVDAAEDFDVHIVEIGGTVGDYESPPFFEAIRQLANKVGRNKCAFVHVVYLPYLGTSKEIKTKPAQNATRDLRAVGIVPDILVARSEEKPGNGNLIRKLSIFCGVDEEAIALLPNAKSVYEVPLTLEHTGIGNVILKKLGLKQKKPNLKEWTEFINSLKELHERKLKIGVIAKYMDNDDTYRSVFEALISAGYKHGVDVDIKWIDSEELESESPSKLLGHLDGILVPGGFGSRGLEGKIKAATYALKKQIPYLGLCLGMQVGAVAFAREIGLKDAHTLEAEPNTKDPIIYIMEGQEALAGTGGTMRLGDYECVLVKGTKVQKLYKTKKVLERHRHRYEFNNEYRNRFEKNGMIVAGHSPDGNLVEIIEHKNHPFFVGCQFHPEFKSRPQRPHPLFEGFIARCKSG